MKRRLQPLLFGFIAVITSAFLHAAAAEYDLIIRNGKIVDGSGNPWFHGDVAINEIASPVSDGSPEKPPG